MDKQLRIQQSFQDIGEDTRRTGDVFAALIRERARRGTQLQSLTVGVPTFDISAGDSESAGSSVRRRTRSAT